MAWMNVTFPPRLSFGIQCDPEWESTIVATTSGFESRNLNWANARHNYDASFAIRTASDHAEIRTHFHMARGQFHSWPLIDPLDHDCVAADGAAVLAADDSDGAFQLVKRYGSGEFAYYRKITRPYDVTIYVNDSPTSDYMLDEDTGRLIIFDTDASTSTIAWGGKFYVPCRYDTTKLPVVIQNKKGTEFLVSSDSIPIVEVKE